MRLADDHTSVERCALYINLTTAINDYASVMLVIVQMNILAVQHHQPGIETAIVNGQIAGSDHTNPSIKDHTAQLHIATDITQAQATRYIGCFPIGSTLQNQFAIKTIQLNKF